MQCIATGRFYVYEHIEAFSLMGRLLVVGDDITHTLAHMGRNACWLHCCVWTESNHPKHRHGYMLMLVPVATAGAVVE